MEPYRPLYHITPAEGWINDPNGLCFFKGQWHAFFQYYHSREADSMQWGHAVSRDLAHWQRLPTAIGPDEHGQIWSGSAVVDHNDTSGLFGGKAGMVCLFTYWDRTDHRQCQGLAYSADGLTFHKHPANPVIRQLRHLSGHPDDKDFRDPKVFWHADTGRWIMAVAGGKLRIFSSPDLVHWRFESIDESLTTECPDIFPMNIDGDTARQTWVLSGGGRWCIMGNFDGHRFIPQSPRMAFTQAADFYAGQTFNDAPDGRRIMLSWLHCWQYGNKLSPQGITHPMPTSPWAGGCLTVPYELSLRTTRQGVRLIQQPVAELTALRVPLLEINNTKLSPGENPLAGIKDASLDIELEIDLQHASRIGLKTPAGSPPNYLLAYDALRGILLFDRRNSGLENVPNFCKCLETPLPPRADGILALRILLDRNCIEIFDADGLTILPAVMFPDPSRPTLELFTEGGVCRIRHLAVYSMSSAIT